MPLRATRRPLHVADRQLVGGRLGHPGDQLVRLVDHHDVVVGDHRHALDRVDGEQRVVGDDQVGAVGLLARHLDEALLAERAPRRPQALAVVDRDLPPLAVGVPRRVVALAGPAGAGFLLGPGPQVEDLLGHRALRHLHQRTLVVGHALADAVQADVVGAALEDGVRRVDGPLDLAGSDRLDQPRDVALDQLVLEREGRRGDDHPAVVEQRGHEVPERLAGAGAGLDEQVLALAHRRRDRLGHRHLAGPLLAAERVDGHGEHVADERLAGQLVVQLVVVRGHRATLCPGGDRAGTPCTGGLDTGSPALARLGQRRRGEADTMDP